MVKTEYGSHIGVTLRVVPKDKTAHLKDSEFKDVEDVKGFGPLGAPLHEATHVYISPDVLNGVIGKTHKIDVPGAREIPPEKTMDGTPEVEVPLDNFNKAHITRFS